MPLGDPTERIAVLRTDLEQWQELLRWTHGHFHALDIAEGYRAGRPEMKKSKITNLSATVHDRIEGYLNAEPESLQAE